MYNNQYPAVKLNRQKDTAGEKLKIGKCGAATQKIWQQKILYITC